MRTFLLCLMSWLLASWAAPASAQPSTYPATYRAATCVMWGPDRNDCFVRGQDNRMHHVWRNGGTWSGFELLGGTLASAVGCITPAANNIHCFVKGTNGGYWHRSWTGGPLWGPGSPITEGWSSIGGGGADYGGNPSCVSLAEGRIDCFGIDRERVVTRRSQQAGRWGAWERLPGLFLPRGHSPTCVVAHDGSGAASAPSPGRLTPVWCFAHGSDNALWMTRVPSAALASPPPTWTSLGGVLTSTPSCVASDLFRVHCFARGEDGELNWQTIDSTGGSGWRELPGLVLSSDPQCISRNERRIDCFARGADDALHNIGLLRPAGGGSWRWTGWQSWGGVLTSAPTCVTYRNRLRAPSDGDGRIDCVARGTNNALWHIASYPRSRTAWVSLGGVVHPWNS